MRTQSFPLAEGSASCCPGRRRLPSPVEESQPPEVGQGLPAKGHCLRRGATLLARAALTVSSGPPGSTALTVTQTVCLSRMSLLIFNDENAPGDRSAESCDFLFSPPELSGRSPVLRLSQKENVPPKATAKAVKVSAFRPCRSDPVSHLRSPWNLPPGELAGLAGPRGAWPVQWWGPELLNRCSPPPSPTGDLSDASAGPTDTQDPESQRERQT